MNVVMPRNASPGRIAGSATCRYCRKKPHPSMRAAASSSSGTAPLMYCRIQKIPNAFAAAGTMSAGSVPTQPSRSMITNCGMSASWAGSMYASSSRPNRIRLPGKSNLANVKAASESKNSTSPVTQVATMNVLSIEPKKSMLSNRRPMLAKSSGPNTSFGGTRRMSSVVLLAMTAVQ
jgi:hypothetical protein